MQLLPTVHSVIFNNLCNHHWSWYLFYLLEVHDRNKKTAPRDDYVHQAENY